jgi:transcriptional regulator with XRE-family HTH domain
MKQETITQKFLRQLDASVGSHYRIAEEAGISQAAISRYYTRKVSPSLAAVEALSAVFDAYEKRKSTQRVPHAKRGRVGRDARAASALTQ